MHMFFVDTLRRLRREERGNVFVLFGAAAIPLLLIMGGAVDFARYTRYKTELSNAVDAAALALARQGAEKTEEEADTFVTNFVTSFMAGDENFTVQEFEVDKLANGFLITATGAMDTMFLPIGAFAKNGHGINSMDVNIVAEVVNASNRLELALVLDATGSMNCVNTVESSCSTNWATPSADSRIVALRSAATTLVNTLMTAETNDPNQIKIGVVPFEGAVNIGATYAATPPSWVDWSNQASAYWNGRNFNQGLNASNVPCSPINGTSCKYVGHKWLFDQLTSANSSMKWGGCVEMRNPPYDVLDTTPTTGDTLFVPFFWPDEPDRNSSSSSSSPYQYTTTSTYTGAIDTRYNSNNASSSSNTSSTNSSYNYTYLNNYIADKYTPALSSPSWASARPPNVQGNLTKYRYTGSSTANKAYYHSGQLTAATTFPYTSGPNRGCPEAIVPLTSTKSTVLDRVSDLVAFGAMGTFIPTGLAWGWHILSSNEPFTQGIAPGTANYDRTLKAIVLFTDGDNSVTGYSSNPNNSYFSGYGYLSANRLGTTSSASTANTTLNTKTTSLCTNIKTAGIRLYVITLGSISSATTTLMSGCASEVDGDTLYYHAPGPADLADIFHDIGEDLSDIHLSM